VTVAPVFGTNVTGIRREVTEWINLAEVSVACCCKPDSRLSELQKKKKKVSLLTTSATVSF
jgi:hypothetical protein